MVYLPEPCKKLEEEYLEPLIKNCKKLMGKDYERIHNAKVEFSNITMDSSDVNVFEEDHIPPIKALQELIAIIRVYYDPQKTENGLSALNVDLQLQVLFEWAYADKPAEFKATKPFPDLGTEIVKYRYPDSAKKLMQDSLIYLKTVQPRFFRNEMKEKIEKEERPSCLVM